MWSHLRSARSAPPILRLAVQSSFVTTSGGGISTSTRFLGILTRTEGFSPPPGPFRCTSRVRPPSSYTSQVKKASVTEAKNNLSAILHQVREGESYLILDRGKPVARLDPVHAEERGSDERLADLERRGLLRRGVGKVRKDLLETAPPPLPRDLSAVARLLEERKAGR